MPRIPLIATLILGTVSPAFCGAIVESQTSTPGTVGVPYEFDIEFQNTDYANSCLNIRWLSAPPGVQLYTGLGFSCDLGASKPFPQTAWTEIHWTPAQAGIFQARIQVTNNTNTYSAFFNFTITVQPAPPPPSPLEITTSSLLPDATVNQPYSVAFSASGGTPGYSWSLSGDVPTFWTGLSLAGEPTISFSGTPSQAPASPYIFTAKVTDSTGATASKQFSLTVSAGALTITTASPVPDAKVNQAYGPLQFAATGGTPDYSWQMIAGPLPLPAGFTFSKDGVLKGTPSGVSNDAFFQFAVQVTDSKGEKTTKDFQLTVRAASRLNITLLDPVPLDSPPPLSAGVSLLQGAQVSSDPGVLASDGARSVQGVAADGFSQLVVKVPTEKADQKVQIELVPEPGCDSGGSAWFGGVALPGQMNALNPLEGAGKSVQAVSAEVSGQAFAFAVYVSPADFDCAVASARGATAAAKERSVTLHITSPDGNTYADLNIRIVRPPVLLVHGLNADASAWDQVTPVWKADLQVFRADYSDPITVASVEPDSRFKTIKGSAFGFTYNAPKVLQQLKTDLSVFRSGANPIRVPVAAVQMDVVGHSMGGLVSRAMTIQGDYYAPETLMGGYIHKLITVGTPHLGSPYAAELEKPSNACTRFINELLLDDGYVTQAVTPDGQVIDGALKELRAILSDSDSSNSALTRINSGPVLRPLRTAMIAGVMSSAQLERLASPPSDLAMPAIFAYCGGQNVSLLAFLTPQTYAELMGTESDGLVTKYSAFDGLDHGDVFTAVHSKFTAFTFGNPQLTEPSSGVPQRIEQLLLTPASSGEYIPLPKQ